MAIVAMHAKAYDTQLGTSIEGEGEGVGDNKTDGRGLGCLCVMSHTWESARGVFIYNRKI